MLTATDRALADAFAGTLEGGFDARDELAELRAETPRPHRACPDCLDRGCPRCWDTQPEDAA